MRVDAGAVNAEAASDGCFPLITNDAVLKADPMLTAYEYQPHF